MMTLRGLIWFFIGFGAMVALGLLSGCSSPDYFASRYAKGYQYVHYCGMSRCDGKENR